MVLEVDLTIEQDDWTDHLARADGIKIEELSGFVERAAAAALREAAAAAPRPVIAEGTELSVVLGDDAFIRTLNARWRGKDCATNVLSFPAAGPARAASLGDIVVAYETSRGEAAERGMPLADYLSHLLIHGVLHLIGYDHETDAEADAMEAIESRALASLGIDSPYDVIEPDAHRRTDRRTAMSRSS